MSLQPLQARIFRSLPRKALLIPLGASLLVHATLLTAIICLRWDPFTRPPHVTDGPPETILTLAPPPTPVSAPVPPPKPEPPPIAPPPPVTPPPAPVEEAIPDPVPEPAPAPVAAPQPAAPPEPPPAAPVVAAPMVPTGPKPVSFAGVEAARARRIVYVVDASGAMTSSLKFVKEELALSISRLDPSQSFQIVVFREPPGSEGPIPVEYLGGIPRLYEVSPDARTKAVAWLESIQPGGRSEPLSGLTAALKLKPELIFLLTRSIRRSGASTEWGAGNAATLAALDKLNPVNPRNGLRPAVIKAIEFLDEDPTGLLPAIAELHGDGAGSYRVLKLVEISK